MELENQELIEKLLGVEEGELSEEDLEDTFFEEFGFDVSGLNFIKDELLKLIDIGISPLTNQVFKGFADKEQGFWFEKKEMTSQFIDLMIHFLTTNHEVDEKGILTEVKDVKGELLFEIIIRKPTKKNG